MGTAVRAKFINNKKQILLFSATVAILAAFMPWLTVSGVVGVPGMQTNGLYTSIAGGVLLVVAGFSSEKSPKHRVVRMLSLFIILVSGYTLIVGLVSGGLLATQIRSSILVGIGVPTTFCGGIAALFANNL